jgi:DNA polymerase-3 subunit delta'
VLIGHAHISNFFERALKSGELSHAFGFVGPSSVGKKTFAKQVAANLLLTTPEKLESHPDFIFLERSEDEKTGKLKKDLSVLQSRELKSKLSNTSWAGGKRVVVIDEAELFSGGSGSALLKLLEEPPRNTHFFLLIQNETAVLSTILSRLQLFYFSLVPTKIIEDGLKARGVKDAEAELFARRSIGRPGIALSFLQNEEKERYENLFRIFQQMVGAPFYKKLQLIEELYGDKEDAERGRLAWQGVLNLWIAWFRDWLLKKHGAAQYVAERGLSAPVSFSDSDLIKIIDSLLRVKKLLRENIHPRLVIEEALLKI